MNVLIIMGAVIAVLIGALYLSIRGLLSQKKEIGKLKSTVSEQTAAIEKRDKYLQEWELIRNETEKKKESIRTGNPDTDFNNSLDVLRNLGRAGKAAAP